MILLSRTAFTQQHQHNHHNAEVDVVGKIHDDSPECHAAQSAGCAIGLTEAITVLSQTLRHSDANFLRGAATKANMML